MKEAFGSVKEGTKIRKPRGYWKILKNVRRELVDFVREHNLDSFPTNKLLRSTNSSLEYGIRQTGGRSFWETEIEVSAKRKPRGHWEDPVNIETAARKLLGENELSNLPSKGRLIEIGNSLYNGIGKYPGGMPALRVVLGLEVIKKPSGYWTPEAIENEAAVFLIQVGALTHHRLRELKRSDLSVAITRLYPGGMKELKGKIQLVIGELGQDLLENYRRRLDSGEDISFEEFVRRIEL